MRRPFITTARALLGVAWFALVVGVVAISLGAQLAPRFERQLVIVRGGSMAPTIPLGALVALRPVAAGDLRTGDIVTVRTESSRVVTHRITGVSVEDGRVWLTTKGDADTVSDANRVPADQVIGRVEAVVPVLGFVMAFLSLPSGMLAFVSLVTAMMLARWALGGLLVQGRQPDLAHAALAVSSG